jgi:hypothetical protein
MSAYLLPTFCRGNADRQWHGGRAVFRRMFVVQQIDCPRRLPLLAEAETAGPTEIATPGDQILERATDVTGHCSNLPHCKCARCSMRALLNCAVSCTCGACPSSANVTNVEFLMCCCAIRPSSG